MRKVGIVVNLQNEIAKEERIWAIICHLSALCGFLFPLGNVVGPLVIWLVKRESSPYVAAHAKEAFSFNLSMVIYSAIATLLVFVYIGILLLLALFLFWVISLAIAAIKASENKMYRYWFTLRFVK